MATAQKKDEFANVAIVTVTESAANTLTFKKLEMGTSLFDRVAIIIHRVEWYLASAAAALIGDGDRVMAAITNTNTLDSIEANEEGVLIRKMWRNVFQGAPANNQREVFPTVDDFTTLPGGGIIMLPSPLYVGLECASLAAAQTIYCRMFFTFKEMKDQDYFELMQARQTLISN